VLLSGVQGITDLITTPGLINLDFADVKSVMSGAGSALMGTGSSRGDDRAVAAAEMAISSPLLEASIDGAHGVLLSIQGGSDLGLFEINEAAQLVSNSAAVDANIIFGAVIDDALGDEVRVTVIAAGLDENRSGRPGGNASSADSGRSSYSSNGSSGAAFGAGQSSSASSSVGGGYGAPATQSPHEAAQGTSGASSAGMAATGARADQAAGSQAAASWPAPAVADAARAEEGWASGDGYGADQSATGTSVPDLGVAATNHNGAVLTVPAVNEGAAEPAGTAAPENGAPENGAAENGAAENGSAPFSAAPQQLPRHEAIRPERVPAAVTDAAESPAFRPAHADAPAKTFDVTTTRRRPVVFEEDDDLDVPDFLK